jgi:hypothetical protein
MVKSLNRAASRPVGMAEGPWRLQLEQRHEPVPARPLALTSGRSSSRQLGLKHRRPMAMGSPSPACSHGSPNGTWGESGESAETAITEMGEAASPWPAAADLGSWGGRRTKRNHGNASSGCGWVASPIGRSGRKRGNDEKGVSATWDGGTVPDGTHADTQRAPAHP